MLRLPILAAAGLALLASGPAQAQGTPRAVCTNGVAALPDVGAFPCDGIDLMGSLSVAALATSGSPASTGNNDIWGWTDPQTGIDYALVGSYNGTGFVSLEDPTSPRLVGKLPTATRAAIWRDIKVYQDHAFIVADGADAHGMQVFDLRRLRGQTGAPVTYAPDVVYDRVNSAHNVVINEDTGFAYIVGAQSQPAGNPASCNAPGFHVVDISTPTAPTFVTCFSDANAETGPRTPGYTHDAQCVVYNGPDTDYTGRELCFGSNENVVSIFDVTDKGNVTLVSQAAYPQFSYTHQGWLTEDQRYFLADDELDERNGLVSRQRTIIFDLEDLDDPEVAFAYSADFFTIDHNLYVRGRYAYQSNYEAGLRVLDLADIGNGSVSEVAFFDSYPPSTAVSFNGQWSNYPYFESGLIIVNDDTYGLLVLQPQAGAIVDTEGGAPAPRGFELSEPAPNPTSSGATLTLTVDRSQAVRAELFDVAGRQLTVVFDGTAGPGAPVRLDVARGSLPAGVYIVRVVGESFETARRVVFTR